MFSALTPTVHRPAWVDPVLFPFESRFLELDGHTIHYVDEGHGPPLLLLHGNPTWSFVYRHLIQALRGAFRCVALDYPGFGLSTAAPGYTYQPDAHARVVEQFIQALDLRDMTLMVQDWGGPIGLGAASNLPERFRALVIGDTRAWPPLTEFERRGSRMAATPLGALLIRRFNFMVNVMLPRLHTRRKLSQAELDHYRRPLATLAARERTLILIRSITQAEPFLRRVEHQLGKLAHLPVLIVWAEHDRGFPPENREKFERIFTKHQTTILPDTGHFLQEDAPDLIVEALRPWWRTLHGAPR